MQIAIEFSCYLTYLLRDSTSGDEVVKKLFGAVVIVVVAALERLAVVVSVVAAVGCARQMCGCHPQSAINVNLSTTP